MPNLHNGAILLLHAVSSDNAQAQERIIIDTKKKGYVFGDVFDLIPFTQEVRSNDKKEDPCFKEEKESTVREAGEILEIRGIDLNHPKITTLAGKKFLLKLQRNYRVQQ